MSQNSSSKNDQETNITSEKEEKNNINDNKNSKGIDLKNIDDEDKSVNKDSFMCCNWS